MKRRSTLLIIVLLVLTAAVIVYALFFMGQDAETEHVALPTGGQDSGVEASSPNEQTVVEITPENVQSVLAELSRAENYSCTETIEDHWLDGSTSNVLQIWVSNGRTCIRSSVGGSMRNVLISDGMLYIWLDSVSQLYAESYDGSADPWMRSLTYEDVLELPAEDILSAGYQQYSGAECIYVEYIDGSDTYVNRIYVSVSTGLLMGAEAYEDNVLIYRMYVSDLELSTPDESIFVPPDYPVTG